MSEKSIADQITEGTKEMVEATGKTYEPTFSQDDEKKNNPTETERQDFSKQLVDCIKEGTKEQIEYDEWYSKTYGTKNVHVNSSSVSI
ncbi:MAG TPA: hypothetical protein PLC80_01270 [Draconibacterium sp.]|nr:hypothetical protein [Draconibacterium sp.]